MLLKSRISNMCYFSHPIRLGTDENYDLKSKITFFVVWSSYTQLLRSIIIFQPKEIKIQRFQDSMFHT